MNLDIEDLLAGAIGSLIGRFLLFVAAVWIGCGIGLVAVGTDSFLFGWANIMDIPFMFLISPLYLFSMWGLLNFPFLLIALFYFMMREEAGHREWAGILAVESFVIMLGHAHRHNSGWDEIGLAWGSWIFCSAPFSPCCGS